MRQSELLKKFSELDSRIRSVEGVDSLNKRDSVSDVSSGFAPINRRGRPRVSDSALPDSIKKIDDSKIIDYSTPSKIMGLDRSVSETGDISVKKNSTGLAG